MKCTKCGFISFDFNQFCPKCNRGLVDEQRRLNLPAFRPEPPMLLARLLGEYYEDTHIDTMTGQSTLLEETDRLTGEGLDHSLKELEDDRLSFEEELDVVSLGPDKHKTSPVRPVSAPRAKESNLDEEISFNLDDIPFEDLEAGDAGLAVKDKKTEPEIAPVAEFEIFKDGSTPETLYGESNAEGLTKEIDMQKYRKDTGKGEKKPA